MRSDDPARSGDAAADPPRPPYPSAAGHPLTHTFRTMPDVLAFRDRAFAGHDVARIRLLGPGDVYNLTHPAHLERALVDDRDAFGKSGDFRLAFGAGLVATEGETWRRQRTALQPFFSRDRVRSYADEMAAQVERRVAEWTPGGTLDLQRESRDLTLDVLFAALFGRELAVDGDEAIREAAGRLHDWFAPTSYPLPTWVPTPARRRFRTGRERLRGVATDLLDEAAADPPEGPADADDLLSTLVAVREHAGEAATMTDEEIRDQLVTLIFAGHDTTASALSLAFYELARHPDVRERLHAEVDRLDGRPTADDLDALPVTERVVNETLRLYPPVYVLPRETTRRVVVDGYRIPADAPVWLGVRQVQRDGRFFDAPEAFRPSRWDGLRESIPDFAYAPFGGGPRLCVGRGFALAEAKVALATVCRRYRLEPAVDGSPAGDADQIPDPPLTADMTLRLTPGTEVYVTER
ncbi:MAG: cytochrome P450 [Haloferacaceae archaeon]